MGEMELRLAEAGSLISTRDKEVVDLKVAWRKERINSMIWDLRTPRVQASQ